jgi:hypothetical protein
MSGEINKSVVDDNYDGFKHVNFIFSQNFISLFRGLLNDKIDLRVRYTTTLSKKKKTSNSSSRSDSMCHL